MEQRRQYRVSPDQKAELELSVKAGGKALPAKLADVSASGAAAVFGLEESPTFALGDTVSLTFSSSALRKPLTVAASVVSRSDADEERRFGFEFSDLEAGALPVELYRLFNRRQFYRVVIDPERPVEVAIGAEPSEAKGVGSLVDLSGGGLGVLVERSLEAQLSAVCTVEVVFEVPGGPAVQLHGTIRNRRVKMDKILYGISFVEEKSADFTRQQDKIVDYVMVKQREELAQRVA